MRYGTAPEQIGNDETGKLKPVLSGSSPDTWSSLGNSRNVEISGQRYLRLQLDSLAI
jgi:hypothetical protein